MRDFVRGLATPSRASLIGACGFALLELALCCCLVTPTRLATLPPRRLMRDAFDEAARASMATFRLATEAPRQIGVVFVGSSTARRALFDAEDPKIIEGEIAKATHRSARFHAIVSPGQTLAEARAIVETIPDDFRGVLTFVVQDDRDDDRNRDRETPLRTLAVGGGPTGVHFIDHLGFYAARRSVLARLDAPPPWPRGGAPTAIGRVVDDAELRDRAARTDGALLGHQRAALAEFVASGRARGLDVVLLESPKNPAYQAVKGAAADRYARQIRALAREVGASYWDVSEEAPLRAEAFDDAVHLAAPAARLRFQEAYVLRLIARLTR